MSDKQKSSKAGRNAKSPQNSKYKNEKRHERNKLARLKRHVKKHGMTGKDCFDAMRKCEIVIYGIPDTDTPVNQRKRSPGAKAFYSLGSAAEDRRRQMRQGVWPKKAA